MRIGEDGVSTATKVDSLADAALAAWAQAGENATRLAMADFLSDLSEAHPRAAVVVVPRGRHIELCVEDDGDLCAAGRFLSRPMRPGWTVSALVPLRLTGQAHEALRDKQVELQPWWRDAGGNILFGPVERA